MAIETVAITASDIAPKAPLQAFNDSSGPSFSDVLDILNPLQHIPIINTIYQHLTGDTEGAVADVAGGTLWAGPIGLVGSLLDLSVRADTGKSISDTVLGWLGLEGDEPATMTAENANPANPTSQAAQTLQQTAQMAAPAALAQPAPAAQMRQRAALKADQAQDDDQDGPQHRGDFLVFGAAGSSLPLALPQQSAQNGKNNQTAPEQQPGRQGNFMIFGGPQSVPAAAPQNAMMASAATTPTSPNANIQSGNFIVFGAGQPAATTPQPLATPTIPAARQTAATAAPSMPVNITPARNFPAPERRNPTVPTTLPPPTTGPAALPGHGPSQALATPADESWFVNAVKTGLTKYQAAQQLTGADHDADGTNNAVTLH